MKKWVLVRSLHGGVFVITSREFGEFFQMGFPYNKAVVIAESDDRDELVRFKELTQEKV